MENQIHPNDLRKLSVETWERAFLLILKSDKAMIKRLNELKTWDTTNGNVYEHGVKIEALENLIYGS